MKKFFFLETKRADNELLRILSSQIMLFNQISLEMQIYLRELFLFQFM